MTEPTEAEVEAVARAMCTVEHDKMREGLSGKGPTKVFVEHYWGKYRDYAENAIKCLDAIRMKTVVMAELVEPEKATKPFRIFLHGAEAVPDEALFTCAPLGQVQITFGDVRRLLAAIDAIRTGAPAERLRPAVTSEVGAMIAAERGRRDV